MLHFVKLKNLKIGILLGNINFFLIAFLIFGCTPKCPMSKSFDSFIDQYTKKIESEYPLKTIGTGGSMPEKINYVNISFIFNGYANIEEARRLIIPMLDEMYDQLVNDGKIIPHLSNYPPSRKNLDLGIIFINDHNPSSENIYCVDFCGKWDSFSYRKFLSENSLDDVLKETYEEAKQILANESVQYSVSR